MKIDLSPGWEMLSGTENPMRYSFQKTYADGLDIVLTIKQKNNQFELWSVAESRCSGPSESMDSVHNDLESVMHAAQEAMKEWDNG